MALKTYKPITNGCRNYTSIDFSKTITKTKPEKSLTTSIKKSSGRNNQGKVTTRHKGGGHKRLYRFIDFKRDKDNIIGKVAAIEYDPNRSANIALINYIDGEKRYILAPRSLIVGTEIISGDTAPIKVGNCLKLKFIPEGTFIHNVELNPGHGGQLIRSAGSSGQILANEENDRFVTVRLSSGEMRKIFADCKATIGLLGNEENNITNDGKAGRKRWKGIKPTVRGSVMNPNDHPHGGGEGRSPVGRKSPLTPWGKKALGVKTRPKHKTSNKYIVRRRGAK